MYVWRDATENLEKFDGILFRGDLHPNSSGLNKILTENKITPIALKGDFSALASQKASLTLVFGPEIEKSYSQFANEITRFAELANVVYFGTTLNPITKKFSMTIPTKVFAEKSGTFVNHKGIAQKLKANPPVFVNLLGIEDLFSELRA